MASASAEMTRATRGANRLLGGGFPWLEVLRLELELGSNGGSKEEEEIREEG